VEWGSNGDVLDKSLCLQQWRLGIDGDESCNSFRNGDRGRVGYEGWPGYKIRGALPTPVSQAVNSRSIWLLHIAESEVRVNMFEGHRALHTFRPKVNGWTEGTKRELA
jgi:hypothetical protein